MFRRSSIPRAPARAGLLAAALLLFAGCGDPIDNPGNERYNVLLVTIDTCRADRLGCYGYERIDTPVLDRLAEGGVRFAEAYAACPVTLPSHTTILTGAYPPFHGVRNNGIFRAPERLVTLSERLRSAGWRTGAVIGAYVLDSAFGLDQGFEVYDDEIRSSGGAEAEFFYPERKAAEVTRRALALLKQLAKVEGKGGAAPFFLWVHYFDPHSVYQPPPEYARRYAGRPYDGEIAYVDAELGVLMNYLRLKGLREKTIVAVTSDHGEALGAHGEKSHGVLLHRATLHVPLLLANPDLFTEPRVIGEPVTLADLVPTLLDLLNLDPGDAAGQLQGRSLVPLIAGRGGREAPLLYFETLLPYFDFGWAGLRGVREGALEYVEGPAPELFDLSNDPGELHDLAKERPEAVKHLAAALRRLYAEIRGAAAEGKAATGAEQARLEALGYSSGARHRTVEGDPFRGPSPKDRLWVQDTIDEATLAFRQGRYEEALQALEDLCAKEPENPNARFFLAVLEAEMGRLQEAERQYRKLLALQPGNRKALLNLGVVLDRQGRKDEAAGLFRRLLAKDPENADAVYNLALLDFQAHRFEAARAGLERAVEIDPHNAKAWNNLGSLHAERERYAEAGRAFERALREDPTLGEAALNAGRCFYLLKDYAKAERYLDRARRLGQAVDPGLLEEVQKRLGEEKTRER